jgi:hypothetical protein
MMQTILTPTTPSPVGAEKGNLYILRNFTRVIIVCDLEQALPVFLLAMFQLGRRQ